MAAGALRRHLDTDHELPAPGARARARERRRRQGDRDATDAAPGDAATFPVAKRVYVAVDEDPERARARIGEWFRVFYGRPELADRVAVFGSPDACVEGLTAVSRAGAQLVVLNPVFDEERQAEILAAEVIPALMPLSYVKLPRRSELPRWVWRRRLGPCRRRRTASV